MKVHFTSSDVPLKEGQDVPASCGATVPRALFVMHLDTHQVLNVMDWGTFRNSCRECLRTPLNQRFVYAIVNGQEFTTEDA